MQVRRATQRFRANAASTARPDARAPGARPDQRDRGATEPAAGHPGAERAACRAQRRRPRRARGRTPRSRRARTRARRSSAPRRLGPVARGRALRRTSVTRCCSVTTCRAAAAQPLVGQGGRGRSAGSRTAQSLPTPQVGRGLLAVASGGRRSRRRVPARGRPGCRRPAGTRPADGRVERHCFAGAVGEVQQQRVAGLRAKSTVVWSSPPVGAPTYSVSARTQAPRAVSSRVRPRSEQRVDRHGRSRTPARPSWTGRPRSGPSEVTSRSRAASTSSAHSTPATYAAQPSARSLGSAGPGQPAAA